jgi:hypothetical protein
MNAQLNYIVARQRSAELQRAGQQSRLARETHPSRRKSSQGGRGPNRALSASALRAGGCPRGITARQVEPVRSER